MLSLKIDKSNIYIRSSRDRIVIMKRSTNESEDEDEELHILESDQEILTMITHTNINIDAFRISNSDKEKSIDQTNSDDHSQEYLPFVEGKSVNIR